MHKAQACPAIIASTMEVLALTAALAVAGSPSLWAISMADMGATSTGMDSFRPIIKPDYQVKKHQEQSSYAVAGRSMWQQCNHSHMSVCFAVRCLT